MYQDFSGDVTRRGDCDGIAPMTPPFARLLGTPAPPAGQAATQPHDRSIFHHLPWSPSGAGGAGRHRLSSSAYGLGPSGNGRTPLPGGRCSALMWHRALIATAYRRIEEFPQGGGYVVATKLLGGGQVLSRIACWWTIPDDHHLDRGGRSACSTSFRRLHLEVPTRSGSSRFDRAQHSRRPRVGADLLRCSCLHPVHLL
jgi:hypothetical protein